MNLLFDPWMDQLDRATSIRAGQACGGTEQAADQWAFVIHRAALRAKVYAIEFIQRGVLFGGRLARQPRHLFGRRGHRATAVVAARHTFKRGVSGDADPLFSDGCSSLNSTIPTQMPKSLPQLAGS